MLGQYIRTISGLWHDAAKALQLAQVGRQATLLLVSVIIARSHWTLSDIGAFEWLLFVGYISSFFWVNGSMQSLLSLYPDMEEKPKLSFLNSIFVWYSILSVLLLFVFFIVGLFFYEKDNLSLVDFLLFGIWICGGIGGLLWLHVLYLDKETRLMIAYTIWAQIGVLIIFTLFFFFEWQVTLLLWSLSFHAITLIVCLIIYLYRKGALSFLSTKLLYHGNALLPLTFYAALAGVAVAFDNWLVQYLYDDQEIFAVFRYGSREIPLLGILAATFSNAMITEIKGGSKESILAFKTRSTRMMHILFVFSFALLLASHNLFSIFFGERFLDAVLLFDISLMLVFSRAVFPQTILLAMKEHPFLLKISFVELSLNVVLSICFWMIWGIPGILFATVVSFLSEKICYIFRLKIKYNIALSTFTSYKIWAFYSIVFIILFVFKHF